MGLQEDLVAELLSCAAADAVLQHIEEHAVQYDCGAGSVALHVLAATARPQGAEEARRLGATPSVGRLVMQLGTQFAGGSDLDARGLVALLWSLAVLAPPDSPLLQGLVKRILLLAQRGMLTAGQLHTSAEAVGALGLASPGPVATALAHALLPRLGVFHAAQLGDVLRVFAIPPPLPGSREDEEPAPRPQRAEGAVEALLREALSPATLQSAFLDPPAPSSSLLDRNLLSARRQHGAAAALVAVAAADMDPPPDGAGVDSLLDALHRSGFSPDWLPLPRLSALLWAVRRLGRTDTIQHRELFGELHARVGKMEPEALAAQVGRAAEHGEMMLPALHLMREHLALVAERTRHRIANARDERELLSLMVSLPPAQLCDSLARLAALVKDCPDPGAWAASLTAGPDFTVARDRLKELLPELDHLQLRDSLCALAELNARDPWTLLAYCERLEKMLHVLTVADIARCLWGLASLGLAQAPAYAKMMRAVEKQIKALPSDLVCKLIRAIAPLSRAAACSRLLPKLAEALATAQPAPALGDLLDTCRTLCSRMPMPPVLIKMLIDCVYTNLEGDPDSLSLAGSLDPPQIAVSLWLLVRHLPVLSAGQGVLLNVGGMVERLFPLLSDLGSLSAEQLCDLFEVLLRLGPPYTQSPLATRLAQQTEARNSRGQLRAAHKLSSAWGLYGLAGGSGGGPTGAHALAELLRDEAPRCARAEGAEGLCGCFRRLSMLPLGRLPLLDGVAAELESLPALEPQLLTELIDAMARLRYDSPSPLVLLSSHLSALLDRDQLHEASAASCLEAIAILTAGMPAAVAAPLAPLPARLLARTAKVVALLPHNVTSLLRALARLQLLPQPDSVGGVTPAGLIDKMVAGGMSPDISELAFQLKSCTILGLPQLAQTILASFTADLLRTIGDADAATLSSLLWSLLALREHEHPLLPACLTAVAGISFTRAQLPLVAESTLMLQLEAPAGLPPIPAELAMVAATAAAELSAVAAEAAFGSARQPGPTLREVSGALEHLGLRHGVQVLLALHVLDFVLPPETTGGESVAILLHSATDLLRDTVGGSPLSELAGPAQVKRRLIQQQGWVVLSILDHEWRALGSDHAKVNAMRQMLDPHVKPHADRNGRHPGAGAQASGYGGGDGRLERHGEVSPAMPPHLRGAQQAHVPPQQQHTHAYPPPQHVPPQHVSHMLAQQRAMQQRAMQQMQMQQMQQQRMQMQQHGQQPFFGGQQEQQAAHTQQCQPQQAHSQHSSMEPHPAEEQDQV